MPSSILHQASHTAQLQSSVEIVAAGWGLDKRSQVASVSRPQNVPKRFPSQRSVSPFEASSKPFRFNSPQQFARSSAMEILTLPSNHTKTSAPLTDKEKGEMIADFCKKAIGFPRIRVASNVQPSELIKKLQIYAQHGTALRKVRNQPDLPSTYVCNVEPLSAPGYLAFYFSDRSGIVNSPKCHPLGAILQMCS